MKKQRHTLTTREKKNLKQAARLVAQTRVIGDCLVGHEEIEEAYGNYSYILEVAWKQGNYRLFTKANAVLERLAAQSDSLRATQYALPAEAPPRPDIMHLLYGDSETERGAGA